MQNREEKLSDAANLIENNLVLLGATAIEDKLQDQVSHQLDFSPSRWNKSQEKKYVKTKLISLDSRRIE